MRIYVRSPYGSFMVDAEQKQTINEFNKLILNYMKDKKVYHDEKGLKTIDFCLENENSCRSTGITVGSEEGFYNPTKKLIDYKIMTESTVIFLLPIKLSVSDGNKRKSSKKKSKKKIAKKSNKISKKKQRKLNYN